MSDEIKAIKERRSKITPPPWAEYINQFCTGELKGAMIYSDGKEIASVNSKPIKSQEKCMNNAAFIAAAPTDSDYLLREIEFLRKEVDVFVWYHNTIESKFKKGTYLLDDSKLRGVWTLWDCIKERFKRKNDKS